MKRALITVSLLLSGLAATATPALANPEAERCLTKLIETEIPEMAGAEGEIVGATNFNGSNYYWLNLVRGTGAYSNVELIMRATPFKECGIALYSIPGPLRTKEEYEIILGSRLTESFVQAFRSQGRGNPKEAD